MKLRELECPTAGFSSDCDVDDRDPVDCDRDGAVRYPADDEGALAHFPIPFFVLH